LEEPSSKAIKKLAIGEIKPQEQEDQDEDEMVFPRPSSTHSAAHPGNSGNQGGDSGSRIRSNRKEDRCIRDMDQEPPSDHQDQPQVEEEAQQVQQQTQVPHPRVHQSIQKDHPVDNILGSITKGVTTRSRLATFCENYSFVSSLETVDSH